jgi:hypothetical protein
MFAQMPTPEAKLRFDRERRFQSEVLCVGLANLNTGFDSPGIEHFLQRNSYHCRSLRVAGCRADRIEVFSTDVVPPYRAALEEIEISPEPGYGWARRLVEKYLQRCDIAICSTFDVPGELLNLMAVHGDEATAASDTSR